MKKLVLFLALFSCANWALSRKCCQAHNSHSFSLYCSGKNSEIYEIMLLEYFGYIFWFLAILGTVLALST